MQIRLLLGLHYKNMSIKQLQKIEKLQKEWEQKQEFELFRLTPPIGILYYLDIVYKDIDEILDIASMV